MKIGQRQTSLPNLYQPFGIVPYLLSNGNRSASGRYSIPINQLRWNAGSVQADYAGTGSKKGLVLNLRLNKGLYSRSRATQFDRNYCIDSGEAMEYVNYPFTVNKRFQSKPLELNEELIASLPDSKEEYISESMLSYLQDAVTNFCDQVTKEFFARDNNGNYVHVGNIPGRSYAGPINPGKRLPFMMADGIRVNNTGVADMNIDLQQAGLSSSLMRLFGDTTAKTYFDLLGFKVGDDNGNIPQRIITADNYVAAIEPTMPNLTQINQPLLALTPGAVQLFTRASLTEIEVGDHKRYKLIDPWLGLTWDVIEETKVCAEFIKRYVRVELEWGLLSFPASCISDVVPPHLRGVNGVFLYEVSCEDKGICDIEPFRFAPQSDAFSLDNQTMEQEICDRTNCSVTLSQAIDNMTGEVVFSGNYTPPPVVTGPLVFEWSINGSPVVNTGNLLTLPLDGVSNGDVVSVQVTQGDCSANANLVVDLPCGVLAVAIDGNLVANGGTLALGTITAGPLDLILTNDSSAVAGQDRSIALVLVGSTNVNATPIILSPSLIAEGDSLTGSIDFGGAGVQSTLITVLNTSCERPFNFTVTWEIA